MDSVIADITRCRRRVFAERGPLVLLACWRESRCAHSCGFQNLSRRWTPGRFDVDDAARAHARPPEHENAFGQAASNRRRRVVGGAILEARNTRSLFEPRA